MSKIIIILLFTFITSNAFAFGSINDAKITKIRVDGNGHAMIFFDKDKTREPATCVHSAYVRAFGIDASTDGGKAVLSMALAAKATGTLVVAHGKGICGVYGGSVIETWDHGFIK
ncbi:MAG: hypothetical protein ABW185_07290 [Sedimenticola sp.]